MPNPTATNPVSRDFMAAVKNAVDPQNIIAPGRHGMPMRPGIRKHPTRLGFAWRWFGAPRACRAACVSLVQVVIQDLGQIVLPAR